MRNKKNQIGQTLVEFALILPLFLLLVIGFFDVGRAVFYYSSLTNAVREATRFAVVNKDALLAEEANAVGCGMIEENPLKQKVMEYAFGIHEDILNPCNDIDVVVTRIIVETSPGSGVFLEYLETVSIEATLHYEPITPLLGQIMGEIPLIVQSKMYVTPGSK